MVWSNWWFPKKVIVTFDVTERGMLEKLGRITGFSEEELVRKAVRKYYCGFMNGFNARAMVDESEGKGAEVKADERGD